MANEVTSVNGIAIANITSINGITDANLVELNGIEFSGSTTQTEDMPYSAEMTTNQELHRLCGAWLARSGTLNKVVVSGHDDLDADSEYKLIVLTMNGTSAPSVSSTTNFPNGSDKDRNPSVDTDPNTDNEGIIAYCNDDDGDDGYAARFVVDAADESVTYGTAVEFCSNDTASSRVAHDKVEAGKFLLAWKDVGDGDIYVAAGTTSGTTITLGTKVKIIDTGSSPSIAADPNNARKYIMSWISNSSPYYMSYVVVSVDASRVCSLGTVATDDEGLYGDDQSTITFDHKTANKCHTVQMDRNNSHYVTVKGMTLDGTDITLGTKEVVESNNLREGCSITSDYFIANTGIIQSERGDGNDVRVYAWTVDGLDYTIGTKVISSTTPSSSRCATVASPYTAGLHLAIYQEHDGSVYELAAQTHLLGGTY